MRIDCDHGWFYYIGDDSVFDDNKVGKWMYFFNDREFISRICSEAVEKGVVEEAKHSNAKEGVACFYLNCDDLAAHKNIISFFIDNKLIRKTKSGRFYNLSFKLDNQTLAGEYGKDFQSEIKLDKFIDLNTGEWLL
jgi:hypothetical protein